MCRRLVDGTMQPGRKRVTWAFNAGRSTDQNVDNGDNLAHGDNNDDDGDGGDRLQPGHQDGRGERGALNAGRSTDPDTRLMLTILPMVTTMWAMMMVMMMMMATDPDTKLMLTNDNQA